MMRFDLPDEIPHDVPRRRQPRESEAPHLESSPLELHRESLAAQAGHPRRVHQPISRSRHYEFRGHDLVEVHRIPHDRRPQRNRIPPQAIGVSLREEEVKLLSAVGRFRVVSTGDLAKTIYGDRSTRLERELAFLRQKGFVEVDTVQARRDGQNAQAIVAAFDGIRPHPATYCYLKPDFLPIDMTWFEQERVSFDHPLRSTEVLR